jgi:hypothetical protein
VSRPVGWRPLPLRCPSCAAKVRERAILLAAGALRCERCQRLYFAVVVPQVALVWIAEVSAVEVQQLRAAALSIPDTIRRLGGEYPSAA